MSVEIVKVASRRQLKAFAEFPNVLYKGNPYYVPTLVSDDLRTFDRERNAAFEFCQADFFLAYRDGVLCGRVAAIINPRANKAWGRESVRFGWIDFIEDIEVCKALVDTVAKWGRERGMNHIEGPLGFTDFDAEGLLVEGYEELGTFVTLYHHPYYKEYLESLGFGKETDWVERRLVIPESLPEKYSRYAALVKERFGLQPMRYTRRQVRSLGIGQKFFDLVNRTYCVLYGYSTLSERQIKQYADLYLSLLDLDLVSFINDSEGRLVAFGVMVPSLSKALQKCNGKYLPFGWWHLLRALVFKNTDTVDMLLIAVDPEYQTKGVPALIINEIHPKMAKYGFKFAETNPELEDNSSVRNLWSAFEGRQHRRRRVYGKEL